MVAYSFQRRFCDDVAALAKRQTIRGLRKRHAQPGEPVQLYFAMRTKHCRKLVTPDPICVSADPITIMVPDNVTRTCQVSLDEGLPTYIDEFARADGFSDADDFARFWRDVHGPGLFEGVLIKWTPA